MRSASDPTPPAAGRDRPAPLRGRRLLVLEDEMLIAMDIATAIEEAGGVAVTAKDARAAHAALDAAEAQGGVAAAVLDVDLGGHTSEEVARRLREAGVPFVFYTASLRRADGGPLGIDAPVVVKPAPTQAVVAALARTIAAR